MWLLCPLLMLQSLSLYIAVKTLHGYINEECNTKESQSHLKNCLCLSETHVPCPRLRGTAVIRRLLEALAVSVPMSLTSPVPGCEGLLGERRLQRLRLR